MSYFKTNIKELDVIHAKVKMPCVAIMTDRCCTGRTRLGGGWGKWVGLGGGGRRKALTIRLRVVRPRLGVRDGGLAWELLLEVPAETGWEAVGRRIPKASRHAH